jgi:hypothetical protein
VAVVRKRTIPTERQPLVGEVSANILLVEGVAWSAQRITTAVNLGFPYMYMIASPRQTRVCVYRSCASLKTCLPLSSRSPASVLILFRFYFLPFILTACFFSSFLFPFLFFLIHFLHPLLILSSFSASSFLFLRLLLLHLLLRPVSPSKSISAVSSPLLVPPLPLRKVKR